MKPVSSPQSVSYSTGDVAAGDPDRLWLRPHTPDPTGIGLLLAPGSPARLAAADPLGLLVDDGEDPVVAWHGRDGCEHPFEGLGHDG